MIVRRRPAAMLGLGLSLAVLAVTPSASAEEDGPAKDDRASVRTAPTKDTDPCSEQSTTRLRVESEDDGVLRATGTVWTTGTARWDWRFKHNADLSARGAARAHQGGGRRVFHVTRKMVNLMGPDHFVFRAKNGTNGEVCRVDVFY